uniref:Uncharacterized protein n=1 Tax=Acanthochromis polyacanthus TaxID=80966 RepID=A0A3Q1F0T9_9TELE
IFSYHINIYIEDTIIKMCATNKYIIRENGSREFNVLLTMMSQNRAVLDYILISQGGTCDVIGAKCCTFSPDHNATIQEMNDHLSSIAKTSYKPIPTGLFDWMRDKIGL